MDWLSSELVRGGWKLKRLHRLILNSETYQLSASPSEQAVLKDPQNHFLWRQNVQRLEAEAIRDSMLHIAGILDTTMYGPGTLDESMHRRSIYFRIKRSRIVPFLQVFDLPEPLSSQAVRPTTTVSPQALLLLNNRQVRAWAEAFAQRLQHTIEQSPQAAIKQAYRIALQRNPSANELKAGTEFLSTQARTYEEEGKQNSGQLALDDFCQAILCLNELVYIN